MDPGPASSGSTTPSEPTSRPGEDPTPSEPAPDDPAASEPPNDDPGTEPAPDDAPGSPDSQSAPQPSAQDTGAPQEPGAGTPPPGAPAFGSAEPVRKNGGPPVPQPTASGRRSTGAAGVVARVLVPVRTPAAAAAECRERRATSRKPMSSR